MVNWQIEIADVVDWATNYTGPKFHALLGDAPYELKFMGKRWDATGVSFQPETWEALGECLHPGAIGMVFASAKGWHRLACAIEDAGMIIQPSIFGWVNGQGFPKSIKMKPRGKEEIWKEHKYGAHALKPSLEPIIVFQKPWEGKRLNCIVETGAGAMWIEGARIETSGMRPARVSENHGLSRSVYEGGAATQGGSRAIGQTRQGRWPSNFFLQHHPDCHKTGTKQVKGSHDTTGVWRASAKNSGMTGKQLGQNYDGGWEWTNSKDAPSYTNSDGYETIDNWECVPECPVRQLGEMSGERGGHSGIYRRQQNEAVNDTKAKGWGHNSRQAGYRVDKGDNGTASRFFFQSHWSYENVAPVMYCPKAHKAERNSGLDGFYWQRDKESSIGFSRITKGEWDNLPEKQRRQGNVHTTVKPIALGIWLSRLLSPPIEYSPRRLLVPFAGVGSEVVAAILSNGWEEITGIELLPENAEAAIARCQWWEGWKQQAGLDDPKEILRESKGKKLKPQLKQLELT